MESSHDFYLPSMPPETLRPFTLQVLSEKRVVGSAVRRVQIKPHRSYQTETGKIGKHTAFAAKVDHAAPRKYTDVTKCCIGYCEVMKGAGERKEISDEAYAKLEEFRQTRSAARAMARGQRDRAESRLVRKQAPGEDALVEVRRTILAAQEFRMARSYEY